MAKLESSTKRVAISRANAQMVIVLSIGVFITVFCLFAAKAVWSLNSYQSRVIDAKQETYTTLKKNIDNYNKLARSYRAFNAASTNVIGGTPGGTGDNDGSNSKIILDALPSSYDFPALTSSVEKIVLKSNLKITSISGTDDQVAQEANSTSVNPEIVPIPFSLTVNNANYAGVQTLIESFQKSIRPMQIDKIIVSGGGDDISITVDGHTYFLPGKEVSVTKKVIK